MQIDYDIRANVMVEALPYLQEYNDKVVVVKYGGNAMTNETLKQAVMQDIVLLSLVGIKVVLVHGGGPEINAMLKKINKPSEFVNGLRYTDEETIDIVQMVLAGKVNKDLVQLLQQAGGKAIGLCGLDGKLIQAEQLNPDLGFVGEITDVNPEVINTALNNGYIPVISTVATGKNGEVYNINADTAAARIAAEMKAANLILLTDIKGLLEDKDDENTLIRTVGVSEVPYLKKQGIITGGMIPKIDCCVEAVRRGVKKTNIIDGRIPHSILIELLTDTGAGAHPHQGFGAAPGQLLNGDGRRGAAHAGGCAGNGHSLVGSRIGDMLPVVGDKPGFVPQRRHFRHPVGVAGEQHIGGNLLRQGGNMIHPVCHGNSSLHAF